MISAPAHFRADLTRERAQSVIIGLGVTVDGGLIMCCGPNYRSVVDLTAVPDSGARPFPTRPAAGCLRDCLWSRSVVAG